MPNPATTREQRRRKTKAQLIDEIDSLEQRASMPMRQGGSCATLRTNSSRRHNHRSLTCPVASIPCNVNTRFARSIPTVVTLFMASLLFQVECQTSILALRCRLE